MEDAIFNKLTLRHRMLRKWVQFHRYMRRVEKDRSLSLLRVAGSEVGQWPATDFPVTTSAVKAFIWWLALPIIDSPSEWIRENGPRGHSFTYLRVLSLNLLSYVEEMEWREEEKGKYAFHGDVDALRREMFAAMRKIAV